MKKRILVNLILFISILFGTQVYATDTAELPSKYDLRNDINISVENQKDKPWCGAYADTKTLETYLQKTKGLNYNLSEGYEKSKELFGSSSPYNCITSFVLESDYPNKVYSKTEENQKRFEEVAKKAVVINTESLRGLDEDSTKLKQYIMKYGATDLTAYIDNQYYNYNGGGIYHKNEFTGVVTEKDIHALIIIGWDDNYSKDNFIYEKPKNNGAWLVLNSWGSNWGNKGTCWVSYEDKYIDWIDAIKSVTLANGEIIRTELENKQKVEQKEEITNTQYQIKEQPKKQNIFEMIANKMHLDEQDIMIICVLSALVLSVIIVTVIYCKKRKKTNNKKEADKEKETEKELSLK